MQNSDFFHLLYSEAEEGYLNIFTLPDARSHWFHVAAYEEAYNMALELTKDKLSRNVYYSVCLQKGKLSNKSGRGSEKTAIGAPGLWIDIDVAEGVHKDTKHLVPTFEDAFALLDEFPVVPTVIVNTGGGLHAYWLFKEFYYFVEESDKRAFKDLLGNLQFTIAEKAKQHGWKIDNTADLARILRVPGTMNHKSFPPRDVEIVGGDFFTRYLFGDIEPYLYDRNMVQKQIIFDDVAGAAATVEEGCKFIQHCIEDCETLSEPEWYAMITNIARAADGINAVHRYSENYPGYSKEETDQKIVHALSDTGPHTCRYIREVLNFEGCPREGCGVKAPIVLAVDIRTKARNKIEEVKQEPFTAFNPDTIDTLAVLKKKEPAEYYKLKQELRGIVNTTDLERAVNLQLANRQNLRVVTSLATQTTDDVLPNPPIKLVIPTNYLVNRNGIFAETKDGIFCVCAVPILITSRLLNVATGEEKIEIAFLRDNAWRSVTTRRSSLFNRSGAVMLADTGLPITSENARFIIKYLEELERNNIENIPITKITSYLGWCSKSFLPFVENDVFLDNEVRNMPIVKGFREEGTLEEWLGLMREIYKYPIARFAVAASFAAPLLRLTGARNFVLHMWGRSRGGKTTALNAAMSVWGNPHEVVMTFNATKVGLERLSGMLRDITIGIDERQVIGDRQDIVEYLAYMLEKGQGKVRGTRTGGLADIASWSSLAITTGEEPLIKEDSKRGMITRIIELYGEPIGDEELARKANSVLDKNFGTAGKAYIARVIEDMDDVDYEEEYNKMFRLLDKRYAKVKLPAGSREIMALVGLGDLLSSIYVFGKSEEEAMHEVLGNLDAVEGIIEANTISENIEDEYTTKAYNYFLDWFGTNADNFINENEYSTFNKSFNQLCGFVKDNTIFVFQNIFKKAMKEGGFDSTRVKIEWKKAGILDCEKGRYTKQKRYKGMRHMMIAVKIKEEEENSAIEIEAEDTTTAGRRGEESIAEEAEKILGGKVFDLGDDDIM